MLGMTEVKKSSTVSRTSLTSLRPLNINNHKLPRALIQLQPPHQPLNSGDPNVNVSKLGGDVVRGLNLWQVYERLQPNLAMTDT